MLRGLAIVDFIIYLSYSFHSLGCDASSHPISQLGHILYESTRNETTLEMQFGECIEISADGNRLAIGAPGFDHISEVESIGSGGIFLYDFDEKASTWISTAVFMGRKNEGIGIRFSMSGDGSRIAIRHKPNTANSTVVVYDTATKTPIGNEIPGCSFESNTVSLSSDGNRVAVSCENFSTKSPSRFNTGQVNLYEWNSSTTVWNPLGFIQGIKSNSFFSFATDFDESGSRIAVSAVLYDGGFNRTGAVTIYEKGQDSLRWSQIGRTLTGESHLDRFGGSISLSAAGNVLVIGAHSHKPSGSSTIDGFVNVFEYIENDWILKGQRVLGHIGEAFGKSVVISDNGSRYAASSVSSHEKAGKVYIYDFDSVSKTWIQLNKSIDGFSLGDQLGYGQRGLAMSADGSIIAVGASAGKMNGVSSGYARVLHVDSTHKSSSWPMWFPTTSFSASQSLSPSFIGNEPQIAKVSIPTSTKFPSENIASLQPPPFKPSEIISPSISFVPTSTSTPTEVMGKFDWQIERIGRVTATFSDTSKQGEIKLTYSISHRNATVKVMDVECKNLIAPEVVNSTQTTKTTSSSLSRLDVILDINQAVVTNSNIWSNRKTKGEGFIKLCVRVDLTLNDSAQTSVNFHEQSLYLTIGLSQGFTISQINLDRDAADSDSEAADVDFGIRSCQCTIAHDCVNDVLVQGDNLFLCIYAPLDSDIEISDVQELELMQDFRVLTIIDNSTANELTEVYLEGKSAVIRTQLLSEMFDQSNPANLTAIGRVAVRFGRGAIRRQMIHSINDMIQRGNSDNFQMPNKYRNLQQPEQAKFLIRIALAPLQPEMEANQKSSGPIMGIIFGTLVGVLSILALALLLVFKAQRRRSHN